MTYQNYLEQAQNFFENLIELATDDELFAGSYIQGHFDLAVGQAIVDEQELTIAQLNDQVERSMVKAYRAGELTEQDKLIVVELWEKVKALK